MSTLEPKEVSKFETTYPWDTLEPKYKVFAIMFAETCCLNTCADHFNMKRGTMRTWSRIPAVAALISHEMAVFKDFSLVNKILIERMALDIYDVAMGHKDTHGVDKFGEAFSAKITNLPAANQALGVLHKVNHEEKMLKAKVEENQGGTVVLNIENANFDSDQHFNLLQRRQEKVIND